MRSDALDRLTRNGWAALEAHGVRTIVDLRNESEREPDLEPRPAGLTTIHVPLDDLADAEFWAEVAEVDGTPLYYRRFFERKPERCAAALLELLSPLDAEERLCAGGLDDADISALRGRLLA